MMGNPIGFRVSGLSRRESPIITEGKAPKGGLYPYIFEEGLRSSPSEKARVYARLGAHP